MLRWSLISTHYYPLKWPRCQASVSTHKVRTAPAEHSASMILHCTPKLVKADKMVLSMTSVNICILNPCVLTSWPICLYFVKSVQWGPAACAAICFISVHKSKPQRSNLMIMNHEDPLYITQWITDVNSCAPESPVYNVRFLAVPDERWPNVIFGHGSKTVVLRCTAREGHRWPLSQSCDQRQPEITFWQCQKFRTTVSPHLTVWLLLRPTSTYQPIEMQRQMMQQATRHWRYTPQENHSG